MPYDQLTLDERYTISLLRMAGKAQKKRNGRLNQARCGRHHEPWQHARASFR